MTEWFAGTLERHDAVRSITKASARTLLVERKGITPITIAPVATGYLETQDVEHILNDQAVTIICLVPKEAHYAWEARELAESLGSTTQTVKEVFTYLSWVDPRPLVDKNVDFARNRLAQHSRVDGIRMICEASMELFRDGLSNIVIAIDYQYEFSEEALVGAIKRHPQANAIMNVNPNGRPTEAALEHARHAKIGLFNYTELMGALNYDGNTFLNYRPPERPRRHLPRPR
ncbi:hypothetical protein AB0L00_25250 [Actinoallomurus sp. NPDC052308]|uniref:hypothetical protein n=1 Tax=Actinoallomurus sp. NPDC052308 TaxID=3155530 RepID=UPI0034194F13